MLRIGLLVALALSLSACDGTFRTKDFSSSTCADKGLPFNVGGYTLTAVHYGDSRMIVIPISEIDENAEFRLKLLPKRRQDSDVHDFTQVLVTISSPDDDGDTPPNWLEASGTAAADGTLIICVPPTLTKDSYKYDVVVENVGQLDPRADVLR